MNKKIYIAILVFVLCACCGCNSYSEIEKNFITDIESSVVTRMEMDDDDSYSLEDLVNAELDILSKYSEVEFEDEELGKAANKYMEGLELQKKALDKEYSEEQIMWAEGRIKRLEALKEMYENHEMFESVPKFRETYILPLDSEKDDLEALKEIDNDLYEQLEGYSFESNYDGTMSAIYKNNTSHDFDIEFFFAYYNNDGVRVDESVTTFENIRAGETNRLTFPLPFETGGTCEFFWNIYL